MDHIFTVSEIIAVLNETLKQVQPIVQGEIGEISIYPRYVYFTLRDKQSEALINCMMAKSILDKNGIELKQGTEIQVQGSFNIYDRYGKLTFMVRRVQLVGEGALKQAFEALKKKLEIMGYFGPENKKQIPLYPKTIGIITSPRGDAIKDFLTHVGTFGFSIKLYPVRVEGIYATDEIVEAFRHFNEQPNPMDILILIRGGTGMENMQPFNSEDVAKAIFASKIPVVTGIGHENDTTIADMVADLRASTPTAAARAVSEHWREAPFIIQQFEETFTGEIKYLYDEMIDAVHYYEHSYVVKLEQKISDLKQNIELKKMAISTICGGLIQSMKRKEEQFRKNFLILTNMHRSQCVALLNVEKYFQTETTRYITGLFSKLGDIEKMLAIANPSLKLKQGYSIIFNAQGSVIKSSTQLEVGEKLTITLGSGSIKSTIDEKL